MADNFRILEEYKRQQEMEGRVTAATLDIYLGEISDFLYYLRDGDLEEVDLIKAMNYIEMLREDFSSHTIKRKLVSINSFFKYLLKGGEILNNPFEEIKIEGEVRDSSAKLTHGQIIRIMDFCKADPKGYRDKVVMAMLFHTGLKINDILSIKMGEIINPKEIMTLKRKGLMKIQLEDETAELLEEYLKNYRGRINEEREEYLFKNLSRQNFRARFMKYCSAAGIEGEISPIEIKKKSMEERKENSFTKEELLVEIKKEYMRIGIGDE